MAKNEREPENYSGEGYQGGKCVVSIEDKKTGKENTKKCNANKDCIKFRDR